MPTYFQRPENALKRANEFIDVGKEQRALDALYDVIKSKKHRTWQKIHEPIMEKYLELCVMLRKSHIAKEGLYQYKNICQQVNIKSLEDVVRKYIQLAERKTEEARQESHQVVIDVDDLEMPDTPESLLLKAVSGEDTQDRTDRAILTPWVKFLWESYRQCLDLLRNNSKVEKLYQDIAQQAFKFCLKYARKTEFRKLCDNLRTHLGHVHKHQHQQTAINLNNPESQAMHLETRLAQLDSAIQMELWQEAFKAVEDIHGLIGLSKKNPRPSLMANYYTKLGLVFWKSGNTLFHASTLTRLFHLSKDQRKNLSQEELQKMASRVLCATLAVPIPAARNAIDTLLEMGEETAEKQRRLANLLMLQSPPKRQGLVQDLAKHSITTFVYPELKNLYNILEVDFHPLKLYDQIKPSMDFITENEDLCQYVPALEDIIVTRVLKQVSQVYQSIEMSRFAALVPFATSFRLERLIVNASRQLELQVRIDHRERSLSFGTDLGVSQKEEVPEGPYIQRMPSEVIRMQLTHLAMALKVAVKTLQPRDEHQLMAQLQVQKDEMKSQIMNNYKLAAKKEHSRILLRRITIEQRKEQLEHLNDQREREEYEQQEETRRKAIEAERVRLESEAKERERQRVLAEQRDIQKKHALERIEQLKKSELGARVVQNIDEEDLAKMDVDDIMAKQVEQLEREKKELQERLRNQEKKVDHIARARRSKEIPDLEKQYDEERVRSQDFWEQQEIDRIQSQKEEHDLQVATRDRMTRMKKDAQDFLTQLKDRRKKQYKEKLAQFEKKLVEERKSRLTERKEQRKAERREKWRKEKEEAEQRARDEALKREREEKERLETEKREAEEREYQEKMARLEEIAAKQRQREIEIEEREAKKREDMRRDTDNKRTERGPPAKERDEGWRRGGPAPESRGEERSTEKQPWRPAGQTSWREREKEKHDSWKKPAARDGDDREPPTDHDDRRDFRDERRDDRAPAGDRFRDERRDDRAPAGDRFRDDRRDDRFRDDKRDDREETGGGGAWRPRGPPRDTPRDAPRDADREEGGGAWRPRGGPRDAPRDADREEGGGSAWRARGPPRDTPRDDAPPARDTWRDREGVREGGRDRRFDNRDIRLDKDEMNRLDRERSERDRAGPPADDRDGWRRGGERDGGQDRDGGDRWRRDDGQSRRDDGPPRGGRDDRREGGRDDRREGGRGDSWKGREGGGGGSSWRDRERGGGGGGGAWRRGGDDRGPPRGEDRGPRDDRGPPRGEDRGPPRGDDRGPREDRGGPPVREERDIWRRDAPPRDKPIDSRPPPSQERTEDDGWTTVKR